MNSGYIQVIKPVIDEDLKGKTWQDLAKLIHDMREEIRRHRKSTGHDLCWYQPELWQFLPEYQEDEQTKPSVPPPLEFLEKCICYRKSLEEKEERSKIDINNLLYIYFQSKSNWGGGLEPDIKRLTPELQEDTVLKSDYVNEEVQKNFDFKDDYDVVGEL